MTTALSPCPNCGTRNAEGLVVSMRRSTISRGPFRSRESRLFQLARRGARGAGAVLWLAGREAGAASSLDAALALYRRKGNLAALRRLGQPEADERATD
jgi:hypothetical protein